MIEIFNNWLFQGIMLILAGILIAIMLTDAKKKIENEYLALLNVIMKIFAFCYVSLFLYNLVDLLISNKEIKSKEVVELIIMAMTTSLFIFLVFLDKILNLIDKNATTMKNIIDVQESNLKLIGESSEITGRIVSLLQAKFKNLKGQNENLDNTVSILGKLIEANDKNLKLYEDLSEKIGSLGKGKKSKKDKKS